MRLFSLFLLLLTCAGLHAQVQEQKLIDRIMSPDMSLGNSMQNKAYYPGSPSGADTSGKAYVKDFQYDQKFAPKAFETKAFSAGNFWQGDFHFTTKAAQTKTDSAAEKTYATKAMEVKDAREAGKDYGTKQYATREANPVGKSAQKKLDEQYLGRGPMSMDQVRELLNKNK